ncbi:restriction endonuclease subunit S [Desulfuromonas thiophila]|uniref:restriction endonuclease subunit S n=1 Tax=Desulfuromonas thiophila TaxID=57664 RepID=UPI0029F54ADC|nr:restriction endonuclease subunit S [Desulfuromonas thiophila]
MKPGWKMVKFGEVVKNANLVEREPEANGVEKIVGLEHIDPENLHVRRWNSVADGTSFTRKFVPGQTLFGKRRAYQRKVAYAEFEGICSGDILTFEPKNRKVLLPELLPFICQSDAFFDHALDTSAGSLSPRTSWTALKDFEFPLPPLDEQKRITELLWAADEAVENYARSYDATWDTLIALSNKYFPFPTGHQAQVQAELGGFCVLQPGYAFKSREYSKQGDRLLRCSNVGVNATVWTEEVTRYWPTERRSEVTDYILNANDIVIAMDRPFISEGFKIARLTESDIPCLLLQRVGRFTPDESLDKDYLWAFLHSTSFKQQLFASQKGTDLPHISKFDIESTILPVPSMEEQKEIAGVFRKVEKAREELKSQLAKMSSLTNALSSLVYGNEEPVHV